MLWLNILHAVACGHFCSLCAQIWPTQLHSQGVSTLWERVRARIRGKFFIFCTSMKCHDWENQTVLSCHNDIFWKLFQFYVTQFFNFFFNLAVSAHWAKMWRHPSKFHRNSCGAFARRDLVFDFFKISEVHPKPYTRRHICAKFRVYRSGDSFN